MRRLVTFFLTIPLLGALVAPTAAQPPTTTEELLAGMVTEEVEPGVYRVLSDGTDNDMGLGARYWNASAQVVAGQDGSVWVRDMRRQGVGAPPRGPDQDRRDDAGEGSTTDITAAAKTAARRLRTPVDSGPRRCHHLQPGGSAHARGLPRGRAATGAPG